MLWENTDHSASEATLQYTMEPKEFENRFLPYDVLTNLAHVTMLHRQGFLDDDELAALRDALTDLYHEADEVGYLGGAAGAGADGDDLVDRPAGVPDRQ